MSESPRATAPARLNLVYHAIVGVAMGLIAPFTILAWIPATLTGMVIGRAGVEQRQGIKAMARRRRCAYSRSRAACSRCCSSARSSAA